MADGAQVQTVEEFLTQQLLKKEAELTNVRKLRQQAEMDVARLQTVLALTRKELEALKEEMYGSGDERDVNDDRSDRFLSNDVARGY